MDKISHDVVYADLVRHIKQFLDEFKCTFFDIATEEVNNALEKHKRGEDLPLEDFLLVFNHKQKHKLKISFKDILSHDSIDCLMTKKNYLVN